MNQIDSLITSSKNLRFKKIKGITVIFSDNPEQGSLLAEDFLNKLSDKNTALFLSGGSTPEILYKNLSKKREISIGAVSMVDERLGEKFHDGSNEKMIKDTGLLDYLSEKNIQFFPMLLENDLEKKTKEFFKEFKNRIAIMGIGEDGHTAGLPARIKKYELRNMNYVKRVNDFPGEFKNRITLTFKALEEMDIFIILAFGSAKENALKLMFGSGSIEEIPARFYTKPEIAAKTILITDQKM